jgi:hypothetical protein
VEAFSGRRAVPAPRVETAGAAASVSSDGGVQ